MTSRDFSRKWRSPGIIVEGAEVNVTRAFSISISSRLDVVRDIGDLELDVEEDDEESIELPTAGKPACTTTVTNLDSPVGTPVMVSPCVLDDRVLAGLILSLGQADAVIGALEGGRSSNGGH